MSDLTDIFSKYGAAIGSGMAPTPPYSPPIGYESMSPHERAAYRVRGGPPPNGTPPQATPAELAQSAAMMVPLGGIGSLIAAAPKLATAGLAGGALLYSTDKAGSEDNPNAVKELQTKLRDAGYYRGEIDGRMGPGTARAQQAFQEAEKLRLQGEGVAAQKAAAEAQAASARAAAAKTDQEVEEGRRKAQQREEGQARLQEVEKNVPWYSQALRDYGTPAGYLAGGVLGMATRAGVTKAYNKVSDVFAKRAEALGENIPRAAAGRVARVNEFWRRGGGEVPFISTPNQAPGFAANPGATPLDKLYQAPRAKNALTDLGIAGTMGGESAYGQFVLEPQAQDELRASNEAVATDPSEVNIQRLQAAKDKTSIADIITNLGRGAAGGYGAGALKMQRQTAKPAMHEIENEALKLQDILRRPKRPAVGPAAPAAAPQSMVPAAPPGAPTLTNTPVPPWMRSNGALPHTPFFDFER